MSHSQEEEIARDYICFGNPDATIVILDATCIEKNLNLVFQTMEITNKVIVCVNLLDEAKKKGIQINLKELSFLLGVPVVGTTARKQKTLHTLLDVIIEVCTNPNPSEPNKVKYFPMIEDSILMLSPKIQPLLPIDKQYLARWIALKIMDGDSKILASIEDSLHLNIEYQEGIQSTLEEITDLLHKNDIHSENLRDKIVSSIVFRAEDICNDTVHYQNSRYNVRDRKIDKLLTSKKFGIPIMIFFLGIIFWLTITGANYPSKMLSTLFGYGQEKLLFFFEVLHAPSWLSGVLVFRYVSDLSLGYFRYASPNGYFLSLVHYFRGFRLFATNFF